MSRIVRVRDRDYTLKVEGGGNITFDTGDQIGTVIVTGDLLVEGNTTTVESETLTIKDNIIVVNQGETGNGVTLFTAGLRVDRGQKSDADFLFDETINWLSPTNSVQNGAFVMRDQTGMLLGLRTNSITTGGGDLFLINQGSGVISVAGTVDYESNVTDDDDIPNRKYVDDQVAFLLSVLPLPVTNQIGEFDTILEVNDFEEDGTASKMTFTLDGTLIARWDRTEHDLYDLRFSDSSIRSTASNVDLTLSAPGLGSVAIDDNLKFFKVTVDPFASSDGTRLFSKTSQANDSGLFFVSDSGKRGELASIRKALAFSIIF